MQGTGVDVFISKFLPFHTKSTKLPFWKALLQTYGKYRRISRTPSLATQILENIFEKKTKYIKSGALGMMLYIKAYIR